MAEAIKVVIRCRPFSKKEADAGYKKCTTVDSKANVVSIKLSENEEPKSFTFDAAYDSDATQAEVYQQTAKPIVDCVLQGFNGTVFAYGQTGTGKTWTMQGSDAKPELRGLIPNSFHHIFKFIQDNPTKTFMVSISYLEIYNEEIRDLLNQENTKGLELKEHPETGVFVKDLSKHIVKSPEEMDVLMAAGNKNRSVAFTLMNSESSRSHSIFTVNIESCEKDQKNGEHIVAGKLNLVDLAGSERQGKTGATGDRLKEAAKINLSLTALGNCISSLVDGKAHVPYRDSKLTRLLQDSLGGNAKTLMVAAMSPADYNAEETLSTLRYANRAKNIKNKPKINQDPKDAMLKEFGDEINRLKALLEQRAKGKVPKTIVPKEPKPKKEKKVKEKKPKKEKVKKEKKSKKSKKQVTDVVVDPNAPAVSSDPGNTAEVIAAPEGSVPGSENANVTKETVETPPMAETVEESEEEESEEEESEEEEEEESEEEEEEEEEEVEKVEEIEEIEEIKEEEDLDRLKELQDQIDAERQALLASTNMAVEEKDRIMKELNERQQVIEKEKKDQEDIERQLRDLQSKLLVGGQNIEERINQQKQQLEEQNQLLAEQQKKEKELQERLDSKLEQQNQLEETYASLQEEVEVKSKKLKKLIVKLESTKKEISDVQEAFRIDREELNETIRELSRETLLKDQIIESFIPPSYTQVMEARAQYDEKREEWRLMDLLTFQKDHKFAREVAGPFKQPVSLYSRQKIIQQDPDFRYRVTNLVTTSFYMIDLGNPAVVNTSRRDVTANSVRDTNTVYGNDSRRGSSNVYETNRRDSGMTSYGNETRQRFSGQSQTTNTVYGGGEYAVQATTSRGKLQTDNSSYNQGNSNAPRSTTTNTAPNNEFPVARNLMSAKKRFA